MSQPTAGQTWHALKKAWRGYKMAKVQNDIEGMKKYAKIINEMQESLGVTKADFKELFKQNTKEKDSQP